MSRSLAWKSSGKWQSLFVVPASQCKPSWLIWHILAQVRISIQIHVWAYSAWALRFTVGAKRNQSAAMSLPCRWWWFVLLLAFLLVHAVCRVSGGQRVQIWQSAMISRHYSNHILSQIALNPAACVVILYPLYPLFFSSVLFSSSFFLPLPSVPLCLSLLSCWIGSVCDYSRIRKRLCLWNSLMLC